MRYAPHHAPSQSVVPLGPSGSAMPTNSRMAPPPQAPAAGGADDEDDAEDLPVMSDDVYGQGLLWQSQSKDNLKCAAWWLFFISLGLLTSNY